MPVWIGDAWPHWVECKSLASSARKTFLFLEADVDAGVSASDSRLLAGVRSGDEVAATALFDRYFERLTSLARSRIATRLAARVDAEDVVMSAYRSFFLRARDGQFQLEAGSDLWRLLVEITLHKLFRQTTYHSAQRRSPHKEQSAGTGSPGTATAHEPTAEAIAAVAEELELVLNSLDEPQQAALQLRLEGYELQEIAEIQKTTLHVVRRRLARVKESLRQRFPASGPAPRLHATQRRPKAAIKRVPLELLDAGPVLAFRDYVLLRQIGAGGSGKVYRAVLNPSKQVVAIKFMRRSLLGRRGMRDRFLSEAQIVARLEHPNVIRIHGIGHTPNGGVFLAMDYHGGGDLQSRIEQATTSPLQALGWIREAARALQHAHEKGVIHCDLKPSNLLLADDGRLVVSDFGLARTSTAPDRSEVAGTPAYLAPEQLDATWGSISPATDVYGLGAVLYALLLGQPPRAGSVGEILIGVREGHAINLPGTLNLQVRELLRCCLSASTRDRFQSIQQFLGALEQAHPTSK